MLIINSLKVFFNNLSVMWKMILYHFIVIVITLALFFGLVYPQISDAYAILEQTNVIENFKTLLRQIISVDQNIFDTLISSRESLDEAFIVLQANTAGVGLLILWICLIVLFYRLMIGLGQLPAYELIRANMDAQAKYSFTGTYLRMFRRSLLAQLCILLVNLPLEFLILLALYYLSGYLISWGMGLFAFFFLAAVALILWSAKLTLFSLWCPNMVAEKLNPAKAFSKSVSKVVRKFFKIYSYVLIVLILMILANVGIGFFTCGSGLILTIPASLLIYYIFDMVLYYTIHNKRFYVDSATVVKARMDNDFYSTEEMIEQEKSDKE